MMMKIMTHFFREDAAQSLTDKCDHFTLIPKWFTYGVNVPTLLPSKSAPQPTAGQIIILTKLIGCWLLEGFLIFSTASKASMFDAESISDRDQWKWFLRWNLIWLMPKTVFDIGKNQKIGKCEKMVFGRSLQHNWITLILGYTPNYIISGCILSHSLKMVHVHTVKAGSLSRLNSSPLEHKNPQTDAFWVNNSACCWCFARRTIENCLPSLLPFPVNIWHYAWIASIVLVLGWLL